MSTDDELELLIRGELDAALPDLVPARDLALGVRRRYRERKLRRAGLAGLVVVVLALGAVSASTLTRAPRYGGRSTVDLAGYTVTLPPGCTPAPCTVSPNVLSSPSHRRVHYLGRVQGRGGAVGVLFNSGLSEWGRHP